MSDPPIPDIDLKMAWVWTIIYNRVPNHLAEKEFYLTQKLKSYWSLFMAD